jgi:hypothetical protein
MLEDGSYSISATVDDVDYMATSELGFIVRLPELLNYIDSNQVYGNLFMANVDAEYIDLYIPLYFEDKNINVVLKRVEVTEAEAAQKQIAKLTARVAELEARVQAQAQSLAATPRGRPKSSKRSAGLP